MVAVISALIIVLVSLIVTRVATVALILTGLSREVARFQARSALTGTGFTTSESEYVVGHPVRRRILMVLFLVGNAGLVTVIASLAVSFVGAGGARPTLLRAVVLLAGVMIIWLLARSAALDRVLSPLITRLLRRWTDLDVRDYVGLLQLRGEYGVAELQVQEDDWVAGRTLEELKLRDEGIAVLGINRSRKEYVGVPRGDTVVRSGDVIVVYGRAAKLADLDRRPKGEVGERAHAEAVDDERRREDQGAADAPDQAAG
ncbi:MAG TPA: TrkA C-terminal domain-containing protein [Actinomycetota bacterium]|nr:TrkA C-terminal domain-containing protein [Actinomycetota bacterium]